MRRVWYTDEMIRREVGRIAEEVRGTRDSIGQNLFIQVPFFAHPLYFRDAQLQEWIEEYRLSTALGIPLAATLDAAPALRLGAFGLIHLEVQSITRYEHARRAHG